VKHTPIFEEVKQRETTLRSIFDSGTPSDRQLDELNRRYTLQMESVRDRQEEIEILIPQVRKHDTNYNLIDEEVTKVEAVVQEIRPVGIEPQIGHGILQQIKHFTDSLERVQPSVVSVNDALLDLERRVPDERIEPLRRVTQEVIERYEAAHRSVSEHRVQITEEIGDAENFVQLFQKIESRMTRVKTIMTELKTINDDPEDVLEKVNTVVVLIEEIVEYIEIIEEVVVRIRRNAQGYEEIVTTIERSLTVVQTCKTQVQTTRQEVKTVEKQMIEQQTEKKQLTTMMDDIFKWFPTVEGEIVRFPPVSANHAILKKQQEHLQVIIAKYSLFVSLLLKKGIFLSTKA
jgi:chromosome segregation ATPase